MPAILKDAERRQELVQFGHAVGLRTLITDDRHEIIIERAALERLLELLLRVKNARPCLDDMAILRYRRCLDDGVTEIAVKDSKPARRVEGMPAAAQDFFIRTFLRRTHPIERSVACEPRLDQVTVEPGSPD